MEVYQDYIQRALTEVKVAELPRGELQAEDVDPTLFRTSEAIREIPRIRTHTDQGSSQAILSGDRASSPSDAFVTDPIHHSLKLFEPGTQPSTPIPDEPMQRPPEAQLSEREQQLLASEGEGRLTELKEFLEKWEFDSAFAAAIKAAEWVETNEVDIAPALASLIYETLARIETVKAQRDQQRGEKADFTKARHYIGKAKNVKTR